MYRFKVLICDEYLYYNYQSLFPTYNVDIALNSEDILDLTYENSYDLYIINFAFFTTVMELKEFQDTTPTIFIDEYYDIYHLKKAFQYGDEYIIKPLMIDDFKIRVDYFYRKIKKLNSNQNVIRYKDFYYYTNSKLLYLKNQKIKLSPNETTIVELLLFNINKPISKDQMFEAIDSYSDGTLRVYISKIKKIGLSLEYNRSTLSYILTNH